jgi:hypothetical protein
MKTITLSLLIFALLSTSAVFALPRPSRADGRPPYRESPVAQRLALSRDQRVQFRAINHDRRAQLSAVQADPTLSPKARRERNREINATAEGKIRSILNANQLEEYDQIKSEHHEQKARRQETAAPAPEPPAAPLPPQ